MLELERQQSRVKWFNEKKGFGFIYNPANPEEDDIFVHYKDIQGEGFKTLNENDWVTYFLEKGAKGLKALEVTLVTDAAGA
jgi:cold shock protein